jgi:hypothetical protein
MRQRWLALALLAAAAPCVRAQQVAIGEEMNEYELRYGEPVDVSITDLVQTPGAYEGRSVRTKGRFSLETMRSWSLTDSFGSKVMIAPVNEISAEFEDQARRLFGQDVEVTGVFVGLSANEAATQTTTAQGAIRFWGFFGGEPDQKQVENAPSVSLEKLLLEPGKQDGRVIKVVGQFRGRNLFGDLPSKSQDARNDWVLKDDMFAVWITKKKPKGQGFELDSSLKRDTGKWLEVTGRVVTRGRVVYIEAQKVLMTTAPSPTAAAQPPPPPPPRPKRAPVVVFAMPIDGDNEIPQDSRFAVQFSSDMNEDSLVGRVLLRYAGPVRPGDRGFDGLRFSYDGGRRALLVDPGDRLRPGRQIELVLLPGIVDSDGQPLETRPGHKEGDVVDVLRWQVSFF